MSGHSPDRLGVPLAASDPIVQLTDMPVGKAVPIDRHRVARLTEGPLQIVIRVRTQTAVTNLPAAGVHPRGHPTVRSEPLGAAEPPNIPHLLQDHHRQDKADPLHRLEKCVLLGFLEQLFHLDLEGFDLLLGLVQLLQ